MKAEMPREPVAFDVTAIATTTSPVAPSVMNCLVPFRTQSDPSRTATLRIEAASLPEDASVNPHAATCWPRARAGKYRRFWSSVPNIAMCETPSPLWAATDRHTDGSTRASSSMHTQ
jgi:hypothetical protein